MRLKEESSIPSLIAFGKLELGSNDENVPKHLHFMIMKKYEMDLRKYLDSSIITKRTIFKITK